LYRLTGACPLGQRRSPFFVRVHTHTNTHTLCSRARTHGPTSSPAPWPADKIPMSRACAHTHTPPRAHTRAHVNVTTCRKLPSPSRAAARTRGFLREIPIQAALLPRGTNLGAMWSLAATHLTWRRERERDSGPGARSQACSIPWTTPPYTSYRPRTTARWWRPSTTTAASPWSSGWRACPPRPPGELTNWAEGWVEAGWRAGWILPCGPRIDGRQVAAAYA
jgi:hypothetical protein